MYLESDPIGLAGASYSTYSYTNNNPISLIDPFGWAPGDPYPTMNAAGIAAACDANGQSIKEDREYAGFLYQNPDGTYSYTNAYPTNEDTSSPWQALSAFSFTPVAWYHTHGAYNPSYGVGNNQYSPQDKYFSDITQKPNYLADTANNVHRYDPDPLRRGRGRVHNYGQCGCSK